MTPDRELIFVERHCEIKEVGGAGVARSRWRSSLPIFRSGDRILGRRSQGAKDKTTPSSFCSIESPKLTSVARQIVLLGKREGKLLKVLLDLG